MATATAPIAAAPPGGSAELPYPITAEVYARMVEQGLIPPDRRVSLWGGRLYEKMAKTTAHAAVQAAILGAIVPRLPPGLYLAAENPIRLDPTHVPLPDLIVARGRPLDLLGVRYPDGRDVLLVVEVAVTSLADDLGPRLARYARSLPLAAYLVADVPGRRLLLHTGPTVPVGDGPAAYAACTAVGSGQSLRLNLDGRDLEPIPFEDLLR